MKTLTPETLQAEINQYVRKGYQVVSQTETTAQLVKPKRFSLVWFFLFFGIFYLPYYIAKRDKTVYLTATAPETGPSVRFIEY